MQHIHNERIDLQVALTGPSGASLQGGSQSEFAYIADDDSNPVLTVPMTVSVVESAGPVSIELSLSHGLLAPGGYHDVVTQDGTALAGDDYESQSLTDSRSFAFPAISAATSVTIPIVDDEDQEGDETFEVQIINDRNDASDFFVNGAAIPANGVVGTVTVTIVDDDEAPAPAVSTVAISSDAGSDDTYAIGDNIEATVTFDGNVDVDTAAGTPQLELTVGTAARQAAYSSGSGSSALIFRYTVVDGDADGDGVGIGADRLTLNGGTIKESGGTVDAVLGHDAVAASASHRVYGVRPTLLSAATNATGDAIVLTYNEALDTASEPAPGAYGYSVAGGAAAEPTKVAVADMTVTLTVSGIAAADIVTLSYTPGSNPVRDAVGNDAAALSGQTVTNSVSLPEVMIAAGTSPVTEGVDATFTVTRAAAGTAALTVDVEVTESGNMISGTAPASVIIEANATTAPVTVATQDDAVDEDDSEITAALRSTTGYAVGSPAPAMVRVNDNDDPPTVSVDSTALSAGEGHGSVDVAVSLDAPSGKTVTVAYATADGAANRATAGDDYTGRSGTLTFLAGETAKTISVPITDDAVDDDAETFTVTLSSPSNATLGTAAATVTITDDDDPPPTVSTVAIGSSAGTDDSYAIGHAIDVTVTFDGAVDVTGTPQLELTLGATARQAAYSSGSGTAALMFRYTVVEGDADADGVGIGADKLTLGGGAIKVSGGTVDAALGHSAAADNAAHKVDGVRPSLSTAATNATGDAIVLTYDEALAASEPAPGAYGYSVAGGAAAEPTKVAVADMTVTLTVSGIAAADIVTLSYTPGSNPVRDAVGNDAAALSGQTVTNSVSLPEVTIAAGTSPVTEGADATFTVTRASAGTADLTVDLAVTETGNTISGTAPASVIIEANATTATVTVATDGDLLDEDDSEITASVKSKTGYAVGSPATAMVRVNDNDDPPTVSVDSTALSAGEGHGSVDVAVSLDAPSGKTVTVAYATADGAANGATAGDDYTGRSGTLTFLAGETAKTISVPITDDALDDDAETFTVTLSSPSNTTLGTAVTTVTITDDDEPPLPSIEMLSFTSSPGLDGFYARGDDIRVTVDFSESVTVTGVPELTLNVGGQYPTATYLSGSPGVAMLFRYQVADGDEDANGVSIDAGVIALPSSATIIATASGGAATVTHGVMADQAGHKVDGVVPVLQGATASGDTLTLTYGEALDRDSTPAADDFTVTVAETERLLTQVLVSGRVVQLTLDLPVTPGDTVEVSYTVGTDPIQDTAGNAAEDLTEYTVGSPGPVTPPGPGPGPGPQPPPRPTTNTDPVITTPGPFEVTENQTRVVRIEAVDTDPGDAIRSYAIAGGADGNRFSIVAHTGVLSFREPPNFEAPADVGSTEPPSEAGDNEYIVVVRVASGPVSRDRTVEQAFAVRVTDRDRESPGAPDAPRVTLALEASMTVEWDEPENPGPPITGYDVQYREGPSGLFINAPHEGTEPTATLTGLEAATLYQVQVRARNEEGTGRWSEPGEGSTLAGPTAMLPFSVPDRGGFSMTSQGAGSTLRVGYGQVETDDESIDAGAERVVAVWRVSRRIGDDSAGNSLNYRSGAGGEAVFGRGDPRLQPFGSAGRDLTPPTGLAIFGSRVNGILVSEAGVPAAAPVLEGRIFAETDGPVRTGLAMANPNDAAATVAFFFTDSEGIDSGHGTFTLGPREQIARFLDEAPFHGGNAIEGTFTFTADLPVAVIALRGYVNERSEFLMTTLPVAPLTATTADTVYFPHFAAGGGWTTQVILVNPTHAPISGSVQFLGSGSETEAAASATLTLDDGRSGSTFSYAIPPRSATRLRTSNPAGPLQVGSVRAVPGPGQPAPSDVSIFAFQKDGMTVSEAGVPASASGAAFRLYVEASGTPGQPHSVRSGIALTNTSDAPTTVSLELTGLAGTATGSAEPLTIPASGHMARFIDEFFPALTPPFAGILRIASTAPDIAAVGLRLAINSRNDILVTTTPPVDENAAPTASGLFFPHFVDSGGWTTQFILFSGSLGQASSGVIRFTGQDGQPLELSVAPTTARTTIP